MTVEEFIQTYNFENDTQYSKYDTNREVMIEFAKYHVEKALDAASNLTTIEPEHVNFIATVNKDSILNSYPLENIK